jgi:enoyl-CoA hydratase/carnithine racemase
VIRREDHGTARRLTLSRPDRRNALDAAAVRALLAALRAAAEDAGCAAVVLAGDGPHFCAGADLEEARALASDPAARAARVALTAELLEAPRAVPKPVVAAVRGAAAGAGAALALACDAVVMHPAARLVFPEARHGMLPAVVAPTVAAHLPPKLAFDLLATGRPLEAAECRALGIAMVAEDPEGAALGWAEGAALLPPARLDPLKALLARGSVATAQDGLAAWLADAGLEAPS